MRLRPRRRCILRHITHLSGLIFGLGLPPVRPFRTCHVLRDMVEDTYPHRYGWCSSTGFAAFARIFTFSSSTANEKAMAK